MRKINGQPVDAITDISDTAGGEALKWDASTGRMVWELQDGTDYMPAWYGGRGVFAGGARTGDGTSVTMEYITIASTGNTTDFGDLTVGRNGSPGSLSNGSRGVFSGGEVVAQTNTIDYITISSTGNATDFGDLTVARSHSLPCSDGTRGCLATGRTVASPMTVTNVIDYITISATGNATDFGDVITSRRGGAGLSNGTRGIFGGGMINSSEDGTNAIEYITISTTGNGTDFGDLSIVMSCMEASSIVDTTRGLFVFGYNHNSTGGSAGFFNNIEYITMATTGNAVDFGDLDAAMSGCNSSGTSNGTRGIIAGGYNTSWGLVDVINYVTIQSTGNSQDFGDLSTATWTAGATSGD